MFELLKKDLKVGDTVKFYLITGKEPMGLILEIGDNYVLLQENNSTGTRIFDKLIGGWDIVKIKANNDHVLKESKTVQQKSNVGVQKSVNLCVDFIKSLNKTDLSVDLRPNSTIFYVKEGSCYAIYDKNPKIDEVQIDLTRIYDENLITEIKKIRGKANIPVWLSYKKIGDKFVATVVVGLISFENLLNQVQEYIKIGNFQLAYQLLWALHPVFSRNQNYIKLKKDLKPLPSDRSIKSIVPKKRELVSDYKELEIEIVDFMKNSALEEALSKIEDGLMQELPDKYKSSLLLKKAQIYSSLNQPEYSEKAYLELIKFNESIHAASNTLSHLYTELARLQSLSTEKQDQAKKSIIKALRLNSKNDLAKKIALRIKSTTTTTTKDNSNFEDLIIDTHDGGTEISKLIDIDIDEHKFTHPEILKNANKPTTYIAKIILDQANLNEDINDASRYPIYLEAAKAYSELNIGSYDTADYLEAVSNYSRLKGNALFYNFQRYVKDKDEDVQKLIRLKDSACSYYLETLNLLSNIDPDLLLNILANYLKLNIIVYHLENQLSFNRNVIFEGQFGDVFNFCLKNNNQEIEKIAYQTIIEIGSASITAWNQLAQLPKGTGSLYMQFYKQKNRERIFKNINEIIGFTQDISLSSSDFLKLAFAQRNKLKDQLHSMLSKIEKIKVEPCNFNELSARWNELLSFENLFSTTDIEIKEEIDKLILVLQPYLNRSESERTTILFQARKIIEKQIDFIENNTTYYGRTLFFGLLKKWKKEIDNLLEHKIAESLPSLNVQVDPSYYWKDKDEFKTSIIISNEGDSTSEGFFMSVKFESPEYEYEEEDILEFDLNTEISAGNKVQADIKIPTYLIEDFAAVELEFKVYAIYQNKRVRENNFRYTLEKEPESYLKYEDIPWKDGPVPPEYLFKGRKGLINNLKSHYLSSERTQAYILYGLTRTGKSSILKYLNKSIDREELLSNGKKYKLLTFEWEFQELSNSSNAREFYQALIYENMYRILEDKINGELSSLKVPEERTQFKHLSIVIEFLNSRGYFPMFFIDELSYVKDLMDRGTISPAFLAALRQYSLDGKASFIFAGTYDIKKLLSDEHYGITGQFVHTIEEQIDSIKDDSANELINVMGEKLIFTPDAREHIRHLSGNIPYFIQILCKGCGDYAVENNRRFIGYPELEKVVRILTGEDRSSSSLVKRLPAGKFQNNQYSPTDPKEASVLLSTLSHINKNAVSSRGVGVYELERIWSENGLNTFRAKLANSLEDLLEKKILYQLDDEGIPVYKFSVDLFRRWWYFQHQDISLELSTLSEE
ncbi:hypothetical protein [Algibacter sp. Ld11]|uniref:hypothetical protein n=1 Tax=Algibacter sp. Ld11 TaxID=649150 RepID=UPI003869053A